MITKYTLNVVDTQNIQAVKQELERIFASLFPEGERGFIADVIRMVEQVFGGTYKNYGKVTTAYHDREHTLQAALCMVRLMEGRASSPADPPLEERDFRIGLTSILLHDVGYLQDPGETEGTGARYTLEHEERGCAIGSAFLAELGWTHHDIDWVVSLIRCTGPRSQINILDFENDTHRFLAQAICTADYLGQMSDPGYIAKLPVLYREFSESDDYQDIPPEKRMFQSAEDLIRKTPGFWDFVKSKVLSADCGDVYRYLARPFPAGPNPYLEKVEENIARIRQLVDENRIQEGISERPPSIR